MNRNHFASGLMALLLCVGCSGQGSSSEQGLGGQLRVQSNRSPSRVGTSSVSSFSLLSGLTPSDLATSDGSNANYELGMVFETSQAGSVSAIRFFKSSQESGTHIGHIFNKSGSLLASVTFTNETASGWQQQALSSPLSLAANTPYVVSVNSGKTYFVDTESGLSKVISSGPLSTIVGQNGLYGDQGQFPTESYLQTNYFRDVVFNVGSSPSPSPSPSATVKPSPSPSVTVKPSPSPSPSATVKPSPSPSASVKPSPSPSPTVTIKPSPSPSPTVTSTPTPPPTSASGAPHLNFSDIVSGSGSGGDNGSGAYVTLYGTNLSSSGSITVGGKPAVTNCSNCKWSNTKIVFQLGGSAASGNIIVTTSVGASNGLPFTITPTSYYYISPNGNDSNAGTYAAPYKTLRHFLDTDAPVAQNTIVYFMNGVNITGNDGRGWNSSAAVDSGGKSASIRLNLVAYPGAIATIGSPNGAAQYGMVTYSDYVTIAGLNLRGYSALNAYPSTGYIRFVGNDVSCQSVPAAFGDNACLEFASGSSSGGPAIQTEFLGNTIHDTGSLNADKTYHAIYFSTDMNDSEIGWNTIGTGVFYGYCRSILLHSSPNGNPGSGKNQYGYEIHDNFIQKGWCDGIGLASVDPSKGAINIYNNVIVNTGVSSDGSNQAPPDGNNTGISINTDDDGSSSGTVNIYNNTLYAAGGYSAYSSNGCFGILDRGATATLTNNVCYQPSASLPYIETSGGGAISGGYSGSHNVWYGNGGVPSWDVGGLNVNPLLANPTNDSSVANFAVGLVATPAVGAPVLNGALQ